MQSVMLDGNVFDKLKHDEVTLALVRAACEKNIVLIVVSSVVMNELESSQFGGIPDFFPVEVVVESVRLLG